MKQSTADAIIEIDDRVKAAASQFHNSAVATTIYDPTLGHVFGDIELTAADVLLVAILSQTHVLITGPTGRGKTALVELVCQGVFGTDGWFLLRLNPHLNEETFADMNMRKLADGTLREAISPAPFLSLPCTVLDECNRTPAALTNILLGFCDGRIELKCGLKCDTGYRYASVDGPARRYHLVIGTLNEGREYKGTFEVDPALLRRFTLTIPFGELRPTPYDLVNIVEQRTGHAEKLPYDSIIGLLASINEEVLALRLDPLAFIYLGYLGNVGRCAHSETGWKCFRDILAVCQKAECRILKNANAFCPNVDGLSEGLIIFLRRAACGLAALRVARTVRAITQTCEPQAEEAEQIKQLREFADVTASGEELRDLVIKKYLSRVEVSAADVRAMLPFVACGGKVEMAEGYVAKHFQGSSWLAARHYARETYAWLEGFFRQHQRVIQELAGNNGAIEKVTTILAHAERFEDPFILATIEPLLDRFRRNGRTLTETAEEIRLSTPAREAASSLVGG